MAEDNGEDGESPGNAWRYVRPATRSRRQGDEGGGEDGGTDRSTGTLTAGSRE